MAINAPRFGSDRTSRSEPAYRIGPQTLVSDDPVAAMPPLAGIRDFALARIQHVRIMWGGRWTAVGMRLRKAPGSADLFEIFLTAGGPRQLTVAIIDEDEAVAAWRGIGRSANLPLILETEAGEILHPYPQLGSVALGSRSARRKHSFLKRRPRFLVRRKAGRQTLEQVVIRGEDLLPGALR